MSSLTGRIMAEHDDYISPPLPPGVTPYRLAIPQFDFEGPLDLLLHLIHKHKLSIIEIPVAFVADKFLEYIELMRSLNLDVASEYLQMAATLIHMKSRALLPPDEEEEEEEPALTPQELTRRLLEYQKYQDAALQLAERPRRGRDIFVRSGFRGVASPAGARPLAEVSLFAMLDRLAELLQARKEVKPFFMSVDRVTVNQRIVELWDLVRQEQSLTFDALFGERSGQSMVIVTFLALLEMARLGMVRLRQAGDLIRIVAVAKALDIDYDSELEKLGYR